MSKVDLKISDFKPYCHRMYSVGAMMADEAFGFDNEFGEGHYDVKPGDIILEGTKREHWVVPESRLVGDKAKYEIDGNPISLSQIAKGHSLDTVFTRIATKRSDAVTWAAQVKEKDVTVFSPEGYELHANRSGYAHGGGDFICCSDNNGKPSFEWGCWPVNGEVFESTYRPAGSPHERT